MILTAARLLTADDAEIIPDGAVAVSGGVITYAGPRAQAPDGPVRALGDVTLLPGLFDCHVHLCMDPAAERTDANTAEVTDPAPIRARMLDNATRLLDAGITTARDLGAPAPLGTEVRDLLAASANATPRILAANAPITVPGGHAWAMGGAAEGVAGAVEQVRRHAAERVDVIKVMTTGGFMTPGTGPAFARFTLDELTALVEEAHRHGITVTTHALGVEGIERAVRAGVDGIEHCGWVTEDGSRFDPDIARQIVDGGVVVCPTMNAACTAETYFCPWDEREHVIGNLRALRAAGATLVAGTDAGIPLVPFEDFADCLTVFAEIGMTHREVIASATSVAAEACGLGGVTGRLRPGLAADLIAVPGDPTRELTVLRTPAFVMARGLGHQPRPRQVPGSTADARRRLLTTLTTGAGRTPDPA
ncbi:amidohydrolase family protein [Amycolatopsis alkalitolerans]|uniref:Amidohydrolase family protein n=1 Tax=Amycolatopsis alkalitolerans TaxID=2547244 RepID=A0A5C4M1L3_9PSEU|nr:amidohydrolase family protein [Amycolatopsis alkalitolerans]TNC25779.1 amidohydrolase family protein [Amycolatopsis alkalitolerans]